MAQPLSQEKSSSPRLDRLLLLSWAHYIQDGPPAQVPFGWLHFTEDKGEDVAN